ncbi:MAG: transcriptional regulator BetI [Rhodospirillales bacterium]
MRTRIEDIRRRELIEAAYETLKEQGIHGTTVARIAQRVGMTPGVVQYYFKNKKKLLEHTQRYANKQLSLRNLAYLKESKTPRERLDAVLRANVAPDLFILPTAQAWLALCVEVPHDPTFARIQRAIRIRTLSNLIHALTPLLPRDEARSFAEELSAMIDGLWIRCATSQTPVDPDQALSLLRGAVDRRLQTTE